MAGSSFGRYFTFTTWGESHGKAIGVVVDGCPAGLPLNEEDIQKYLDRRKPGQSKFTTQRKEDDSVEILSGVFEGKTTGTSISMLIWNKTQRSSDYSEIASYYRPGHADYTFDAKYGFRDYRGGGRSSGRETIGRVAAGAVAAKILEAIGIKVTAYSKAVGPYSVPDECIDISQINENPLFMPDNATAAKVQEYLKEQMAKCDSAGGIIECVVKNMPAGAGEPVFEKLDANLAKAVFSIGAVKGVEIGSGFKAASSTGSVNNDAFVMSEDGGILKATNNSGGILGGISDGSDIILRAAVKPTPSIASLQHTVNKNGENIDINIKGRHDPIIVPRAVVVVESMVAVTLLDALLANISSKLDNIISFYK